MSVPTTLMCVDLGNPVSDHTLNRGLVAWWTPLKLSGAGVSSFDVKGGRTATLLNGAGWRSGPYGFAAMNFDGTDDYAACAQATELFNPTAGLTVSCLLRATAIDRFLVDHANSAGTQGWAVRGSAHTGLFFHVNGVRTANGTAINDGSWYFCAWTWVPSTSLTSYIHGRQDQQNTTAIPASITSASVPLWLGQRRSGGDYWPGSIADFRIYNRALAAAEVKDLYYQTMRGHPDTLRRYAPAFWSDGAGAAPSAGNRRRRLLLCGS